MENDLTHANDRPKFSGGEERDKDDEYQERFSRSAYDDASEEWVPFNSRSDALIAQLYLERRIPPRHLSTFLELLREPSFDASKVTLSATTDIDVHVAKYRTQRAEQRATALTNSSPSPMLPLDIFSLIIDYIASFRHAMTPLNTADSASNSLERSTYPITETLQNISLTHRSLTHLAQNALGRRIYISSKQHLTQILRSPLLGNWTTELLISALPFGASDLTRPTNRETVDLIVAVLRQTPSLRFLSIRTPPYEYRDDPDNVHTYGSVAQLMAASQLHLLRLLKVISTELPLLEELWWRAKDRCSVRSKVDLADVCEAIGRMPRLKRLVVRNVVCKAGKDWTRRPLARSRADRSRSRSRSPHNSHAERPQHQLTSLSLTNVDFLSSSPNSITSDSLDRASHDLYPSLLYLLSPESNRSTLTSLTIDLSHSFRRFHVPIIPAAFPHIPTPTLTPDQAHFHSLLDIVQCALPFLHELRVQIRCPAFPSSDTVERLFSPCSSLRILHLWVLPPSPSSAPEDDLHIPQLMPHHHHAAFIHERPIDDTLLRHIPSSITELHLGLFNIGDDFAIWDEQDMHIQIWLDDIRRKQAETIEGGVIAARDEMKGWSLRKLKLVTPAMKHEYGMYNTRESCTIMRVEFEHLEDSMAVFM
jgi:hypothetical protein